MAFFRHFSETSERMLNFVEKLVATNLTDLIYRSTANPTIDDCQTVITFLRSVVKEKDLVKYAPYVVVSRMRFNEFVSLISF